MIKKGIIFTFINILMPILIFIIGWRYYALLYDSYITYVDEGNFLSHISHILNGRLIYKDFRVSYYMPLACFLTAFLYKLTNIDVIVLNRLLDNLFTSCSAVFVYFMAKRMVNFLLAIYLGLQLIFITGIGYPYGVAFYHNYSIFFCFLAFLQVYKFYETNKYTYLIFCAFFAALAIFSFQLTGVSCIVSILCFIFLLQIKKHSFCLKEYKYLGIGLGIVVIPIILYLSISGVLFAFFYTIINGALSSYYKADIFPHFLEILQSIKYKINLIYLFTFLKKNPLFYPIIISLLSITYMGYRFLTKKITIKDYYFMPLFIFNLCNLPYLWTVFISSHWTVIIPTVHIASLYFFALGIKYISTNILKRSVRSLFLVFIIFPLLIYYIGPISDIHLRYEESIFAGFKFIIKPPIDKYPYPKGIIPYSLLPVIKKRHMIEWMVAEYIQNNSFPTDKIFIFGDTAVIYYLSKRNGANKYTVTITGGFLNSQEEEECISLLERFPAKFVVMRPSWFTDMAMSQYSRLFSYIQKKYFMVKDISGYQIYIPILYTYLYTYPQRTRQ